MKTLFKGRGKLVLTCLIALCAVLSSCVVFTCLFSSNNNNNNTASATTYGDFGASCTYWLSWEDGDVNNDDTTETEMYLQLASPTSPTTISVQWSDNGYDNEVSCGLTSGGIVSNYRNRGAGEITIPANIAPGLYQNVIVVFPEGDVWGGIPYDYIYNPLSIHVNITMRSNNASISGNDTTVYGSSITLSAGGTGSYSWSMSNLSSNTGSATLSSTSGSSVTLTPTKAGTVRVAMTASGDSLTNSRTIYKTITIQKKGVTIPTLSKGTNASSATVSGRTATTTYTGYAQHFTISNTSYISFGTPTSGATRSGSDFYATNARSGAYTVTMSLSDTTNYCWGSDGGTSSTTTYTLSLTINRATISNITANTTSFTYSTSSQTFTLSSTSYVSITLPNGFTRSGATVTIPASKTVGNYSVSITPDSNHCWSGSSTSAKTITIAINKATPAATVSVAGGNHYIGNTLSTVGISGSANVSGTFAWTTPTTVLTASGSYQWKFTPTDTTNYNTVSGNVTVTAVPPLDYISVSGAKQTYKAYESFTTSGMTVTAVGGGSSKTVTNYTVTLPYTSLGRNHFLVSDSGSSVTISYTEGNVTKTASIEITVNKADYDMSGVTFRDVTVTYNGQPHSITLLGSVPSGVTLNGYTYDGVSGTSKTEAGSYVVAPVFSISDTANYNVPRLSATLLINKATPEVTVNVSEGLFYVGDALSVVAISLDSANVPGTLGWTSPTSTLSGLSVQYGWTFKPEDSKNYNNATGSVTVTAVYRLSSIAVTSGKANYVAFDVLDEDSIVITATYATGKNPTTVTGWTYTYPGSNEYFTVSDNGKKVTFSYTENGITKTCELTVSVDKKKVDMSGVSMTSATETYDGTSKSIEVSGTLPEVLELKGYLYNGASATGATDADTYKVEAQFTLKDEANYVMPELSATLTIEQAAPVINVEGVNTQYTYTGEKQTVNSGATVNNAEQTPAYRNNTFTTVAEGNGLEVTVYVTESKNYKAGSVTVTITVAKAEVSLEWTGGNGVYDGTEHNATLEVKGGVFSSDASKFTTETLKGHIVVSYSTEDGDAERKHVGTYAPSYTGYPESEPFCNYTPVVSNEDYTFEITADEVEGLEFKDVTYGYDGKNHVITITGTLPEQVTVKYYYVGTESEFTGVTDVKREGGEVVGYEIKAVFACESGNYEVPETLEATITITPRAIAESDVSEIDDKYTYKGEAWQPKPKVSLTLTGADSAITLEKDKDYSVDYSTDEYNAGTEVDVVVEGKGNYEGVITKRFTIEKATISMEWEGNAFTYNGSGQGVTAKFTGIAESDKSSVVPEVLYVGRGGTEYAESALLPVNAGYYTVTVSLELDSENYISTIVNGIFKHFEIKKAEVSVAVDFVTYKKGDTVYAGSALPEIELQSLPMFGSMSVPGSVAWQKTGNAPATLKEGTNEYVWIFTPTDTTNFAQSNGKLTVWDAIFADISGIVVGWNTEDGAQPKLFTSTTLEKVREYLKVTGTLETGGTVDVADYSVIGSWGSEESPEKSGTYFFTITTSDGKFTELMNGVVYEEVMLLQITVVPVNGGEHKKSYKAFDTFDRDGVIVTAEYNDGAKVTVTEYTVTYPDGRDCFWAKENEYQTLVITYEDAEPYEIGGITVLKKDFDVTGISFEPERTETYDKSSKVYGIKGVFDIGTVTYTYAKWNGEEWVNVPSSSVVNAGTYKITASFNIKDEEEYILNYNAVEDMESVLTIKKAVCNVDNMVFIDVDCDYAYGKSLAGQVAVQNVPEGVTKVEYEYRDANGRVIAEEDVVNAGEYTVRVKFTVDDNHEPIAIDPVKLTVNKVSPKINPTVSGSLAEGAKLYELTFVNADGDTAGKFEWDNAEYELKAGINRCYYTFTPDDTSNFKTYRGYVDLTAGAGTAPSGNSSAPSALVWVTVGIVIVVLLVALVALIVAIKASRRPAAADGDGFYDNISEDDLK